MKNIRIFVIFFTLALILPGPALANDTAAGTVPGAELAGALLGYLPASWDGWITLVVAICAALSAVWPRPAENASGVVRVLYAVVNALGFNAGKARNADDAAALAARLRR